MVTGLAWAGFWFWAFSLAHSGSFFRHNQHSRLPAFLAAWLGACAVGVSGYIQWSRRRSVAVASLGQLLGIAVAVCPFVVVSVILHQAERPWRPEADDALGAGINFVVLCSLALVSVPVVGTAVGVRQVIQGRLSHRAVERGDGPADERKQGAE